MKEYGIEMIDENDDEGFEKSDIIKKIEDFAKDKYSIMGHGMDHVQRVYHTAVILGKQEGADLEILLPAILLHDIGRDLESEIGANHADSVDYLAKDFLKGLDYFHPDKINKILAAISEHRSSMPEKPPLTLESMILSDVDKLDALGAIGLARVFAYGGSINRDVEGTLKYLSEKITAWQKNMYTAGAKELAEERAKYMIDFLRRLGDEVNLRK